MGRWEQNLPLSYPLDLVAETHDFFLTTLISHLILFASVTLSIPRLGLPFINFCYIIPAISISLIDLAYLSPNLLLIIVKFMFKFSCKIKVEIFSAIDHDPFDHTV